jgi:hypothetical protein
MPDIFGLQVDDLPTGQLPIKVLVIIETIQMEDAGDTRKLNIRASDGVTTWDAIGLTTAAKIDAEHQWLNTPDITDE